MSWFQSVLDRVLARAEALGTKVVLEPQNRYASDFMNRIADTVTVIESHGSPWLAIEADIYHMALEERSIPAALVTAQASGRLAHVQISDSNRLAPGWGNVNWQDIFATLSALKYDRWVSVEVSQLPDSKSAALQADSVPRRRRVRRQRPGIGGLRADSRADWEASDAGRDRG